MNCPYCKRPLDEHDEADGCLNGWAAKRLGGWRDIQPFGRHGHRWFGFEKGHVQPSLIPRYTTLIADAFALQVSLHDNGEQDDSNPTWRYVKALMEMMDKPSDSAFDLANVSALDRTRAFIFVMEGQDDGKATT